MANLLAVVIGLNYEQDPRVEVSPLQAAESDARRFADWLATVSLPNGCLDRVTLLLGAEATTARILAALDQVLAVQTMDDTLLMWFGGHGVLEADGLTLITHDDDLPAVQLLMRLGRDPRPTRLILDCCHAAAIQRSKQAMPARWEARVMQAGHAFLKNVEILSATTAENPAHEFENTSLFARALMATLAQPENANLMQLPLSLIAWDEALPDTLHANEMVGLVQVEEARDAEQATGRPSPAPTPTTAETRERGILGPASTRPTASDTVQEMVAQQAVSQRPSLRAMPRPQPPLEPTDQD